ncbi:hypothetical protein BJV82DRAFT_258870 [Fennellomyces sp. T-0311]|nr:hypothetical protein BJV82DRAFT_258870 [Fennellomyces sp. T-0311]
MPSNAEKLKTLCDEVLTGFDITTPYAYNGRAQFGTFQLPLEVLNHAPGLHFDDSHLRCKWITVPPMAKLNRQRLRLRHHVVPDPNYIPQTKSRPTVPPSRGIKLRDVATIMKEKEETKGMSEEQLRRYRESKQRLPESSPVKQQPKAMQRAPVDPVQDILNDIQAASAPRPAAKRHPPKNSSDSSSSSSNSTPSRVVSNSRMVPSVVKKTINKPVPTKQRKPISIPVCDLLMTKAHLLDANDIVETRTIAGLKRSAPHDERPDHIVTKRPRLLLHLKVPPAVDDEKRKKKTATKPKAKVQAEANFVANIKKVESKPKPKAASNGKHNEPKINAEVAEKRPAAPKESPPQKKPTNQEFLKGIRIPKRKPETTEQPSTNNVDRELEEGETISPSPSPREPLPPAPPPPPPPKPAERRAPSKDSKRSSRRSDEDDRRRGRLHDERRRSEDRVSEKRHRRDSRQSSTRRRSRSRSPPSKSSRSKRARSRSPASRSPRPRSRSSTRRSPERRPSNPPPPPLSSSSSTATATATTTIKRPEQPKQQPPPPPPPPAPPAPVYKNATSTDSETEQQCKMYSLMFRKLATTYKHRGDVPLKAKKDDVIGLIDHIQGILNYVLAFYYQDKHGKVEFWHWESLYPFFNFVIRQLQSSRQTQLYALCSRIMGMVRYYQFARRQMPARKQLEALVAEKPQDAPPIDASVVYAAIKATKSAYADYEEATRLFKDADRYLNQEQFKEQFPETYRSAVDKGEYGPGIVIGGEAGVTIEPRYPFTPFAKLHHAAIVAKCVLHEYLQQKNLAYTPISDTDEFM